MSARGRLLAARLRDERGFGMVELLAAMTVMVVGLLAVFGLFQAGMVQIRRASTETTAAAHATGAAVTLKQRVDVPSCASSTPAPDPCSTISPTVSSTGADGHAYRV